MKLKRWEKATAIPLAVLAMVYLGIYAFEVLADVNGKPKAALEVSSDLIWGLFWADFLVRVALAKNRLRFLRRNLIEIASLVLPAMRAFRMLRVLTAFHQVAQFTKSTGARVNLFLFTSLPLLFFMCALGILDVERHAFRSTIHNFGDALWWSLTTLATVGYGDLYPVTTSGRLIAAVLLFAGIGSMSLITANIASWLMKNIGNRAHLDDDEQESPEVAE